MKPSSLLNRFRLVGVALATVGMASHASAVLTFSFDYSTSVEFNDPTGGIGNTRKASLESAAATLGGWFGNTANLDIKVTSVTSNTGPNAGLLASAGSGYSALSTHRGYINGVIGDKILSNGAIDDNGGLADGVVEVNFFHSWDYDDSIGATDYDFKSTIIHELLHAVGFTSLIEQGGTWIFSTTDENGSNSTNTDADGGIWAKFDDFLTDSTGAEIINDANSIIDQALWDSASVGGGGGLFFDGPSANAANGGNRVAIHSANPWEDGSSGSHLAEANALMAAASTTGQGERTLSAIEAGILTDLGFTIIPEPSTTTLLLGAGLLVIGRRQRRSSLLES